MSAETEPVSASAPAELRGRTKVHPRRHPPRSPREKVERKLARERRHRLQKPLLDVVQAVVGRMPLPLAARLGDAIGLGIWYLSAKARRRTLEQVDLAFGDEKTPRERRRIGRRSLQLMARGLASFVVCARRGPEFTLSLIDVEGEEEIDAAIEQHGGAIVFGGHFGFLELPAIHFAHRFDGRSVTADAREGTAADRLVQMRHRLGAKPIQRGDPREIVRELRERRPVGMVVDHDIAAVRGVFVPFFGRPSHTVIGPGTFAVRQRVPMIAVRIEWTSLTRHRLVYGPTFYARDDLSKSDAALEFMARATREIERQIRERPDHWMWLHRRWATRPEDVPDLPVWKEEA